MAKAKINISAIVDQLGMLKAQQADLKVKADALIEQLKATGRTEIEGSVFRATISTATRETLDSRKVRAVLTAKQLKAVTVESEVVTLKIAARTGEMKAVA